MTTLKSLTQQITSTITNASSDGLTLGHLEDAYRYAQQATASYIPNYISGIITPMNLYPSPPKRSIVQMVLGIKLPIKDLDYYMRLQVANQVNAYATWQDFGGTCPINAELISNLYGTI